MRIVICLLLGFWVVAEAATGHPAQVAGIYEATVAVKNADGRKITLNLQQDGSGEFRDGAKRSAAHWSVADEELRVEVEGRSSPLIWKITKKALVLQGESKAEYGKKGLVLRRPR